jgi:hypothetical protein
MSVHARSLVVAGLRRVASPAGAALFAAFVVALAAFNAATNTVLTALAGTPLPTGGVVAEYGVVLAINPLLAALLALAALCLGAFAAVVGSRVLLGRTGTRWADPVECLTHRVVPATGAVLVGSLLVGLAVGVGTLLLVVPGLVVAGHLLLVPSVLATEDVGLAAAFRKSWRRTAADRLDLAAATLALVAPAVVVVAGASLTYVLPPTVEFALGVGVGAAVLAAWFGVATEAYHRLGAETSRSTRRSRSPGSNKAL